MKELQSCTVTACDRDGKLLGQQTVEAESPTDVVKERGKVWFGFRKSWPDCQVYFDWNKPVKVEETAIKSAWQRAQEKRAKRARGGR